MPDDATRTPLDRYLVRRYNDDMQTRTIDNLLAERRALLSELRRENDETARHLLRYSINALTDQIELMRREAAVRS